jgi:hypothetical protein
MGTMYDAVDVAAIPKDAEIVAGYIDGNWPTYNEVVTTFPDAQHVSITVKGAPGARVADCESGDLKPQTAAGWAKSEIAAGRRPCIYYSRAAAPAVTAALQAAGVPLGEVDYWVADWTGTAHVVPGSVATQWADPPKSGGNFDISETVDPWPGTPAPPPVVIVPSTEPEEASVLQIIESANDGNRHVFALDEETGVVTHYYQQMHPANGDFTWHRETLPTS